MKSIVVLISGSGSNLQAMIDQIHSTDFPARITAVVSNKEDAFGLKRAEKADIPGHSLSHKGFEDRETYDRQLIAIIDKYEPDVIVLAGFMRILSDHFVNHYLGRMVNIHPSLLPKYKGLNTHQRAIDAKDEKHGASVHFVTPTLDDGPVILQGEVSIENEDDAHTLQQKVHKQEHIIYPKVVKWLCEDRVSMSNGVAYKDGQAISY